jgi:hypothetical protein
MNGPKNRDSTKEGKPNCRPWALSPREGSSRRLKSTVKITGSGAKDGRAV